MNNVPLKRTILGAIGPENLSKITRIKPLLAMKLTFLLMIVFIMQSFASAFSQQVSLTVKNAQLEKVLKEIRKQSGYTFLYDRDLLKKSKPISIQLKNVNIGDALDKLFNEQPFTYEILEKTIVLKNAENALLNKKITVTGLVTDNQGSPLAGVTIKVKNNTSVTTTNNKGSFTIDAEENAILIFSYVGFKSQEIEIKGRTALTVQLMEEEGNLNQVVVVSYGSQKRRDIIGAIAQVNGEDLKDMPVSTFAQKLQGKLVGVQINQNTGKPGQGMGFRIRGATSGNGNSKPLYVIDGQPIEGDGAINNINPDEIESISILKDAGSSALYGSRASNGVVLITTKKAAPGKTKTEFNAYYALAKLDRSNDPKMMNAQELATFMKGVYEDRIKYEGYTQGIPAEYQNPQQYGEGTDWLGRILRVAPTQNYSLSISDYREKSSSSIIAGFLDQQGILKNTGIRRYSFRANTEFRPTSKIKLNFNIAPTVQLDNNASQVASDGQRAAVEGSLMASPHIQPFNTDGTPTNNIAGFGLLGMPNWEKKLLATDDKTKTTRLLANFDFEIELFKDLKFKTGADVDYGGNVRRVFTDRAAAVGFNSVAPRPMSAVSSRYDTNDYLSWLNENILTYSTTIASNHHIEALAGYTIQRYKVDRNSVTGSNYVDESLRTVNAAGTIQGTSPGTITNAMLSAIGRINYNYKGKYLFTVTIRRDGSSRFGADNKYGTFPSVLAGWIVSDEAFMKKIPAISYLKLRTSYGLTGNDKIGDYPFLPLLGTSNYIFSNTLAQGKAANSMGNSLLRWEGNKQFDIGVDLSLLKDRINFTYDYYHKISDGLLAILPVSRVAGFNSVQSNIGEFEFWGHEFAITTKNLTGALKWSTDLNISFDKNKINHIGANDLPIFGSEYTNPFINQVGSPLSLFYGYINEGVYMTQADFNNSPKHSTSAVGTVKMKDVNGDGVITALDRTIIGDPNPDFLIGFTNNLSYKNFDFNISFAGAVGGDMQDGMAESAENLDGAFNLYKIAGNPWRSEANPGDGRTPRTLINTTALYRTVNTNFIHDASYLTCKNISLGYTLKVPTNKYISKLRLYASVQQAFVITSWPGFSPEASDNSDNLNGLRLGHDVTTYPVPRTFSFGINLGL